MSAYVVSREHIAYLVEAGQANRLLGGHYGPLRWMWSQDWASGNYKQGTFGADPTRDMDDRDRQAEVGQMLWDENIASVNARYGTATRDCDELPGPAHESFDYCIHSPASGVLWGRANFDPVQVLKACDCYEYQSCERAEWRESEARAYIDALRKRAWTALPGYEAADWGPPRTLRAVAS